MGATMAKPKTSAEKAREDEENSQLDNMLGGAFGDIEALEKPPEDSPSSDEEQTEPVAQEDDEAPSGPTGLSLIHI